jgi:hypothetical protein
MIVGIGTTTGKTETVSTEMRGGLDSGLASGKHMTKLAITATLLAFVMAPAVAQSNGCVIKGNVSTKGERIYHVPGQKYYNETRIQASRGERWFCSEEEARAAGWRRSKV